MNIAVTGSTGHIGNNLCRELNGQGHRLRVLVRKDHRALEGLECEKVYGDLSDFFTLRRLVRGTDAVFHLAATIAVNGASWKKLAAVNINGTRNVIRVVREAGRPRLIHFSSIHALEQKPCDLPLDETRPLALNDRMPYSSTKARAEQLVLEAVSEGVDALVLNPTSVIGPHDYKPSLMGAFLWRIARNRLPLLVPGGYDFVDVRDVVRAAVEASRCGRTGERYLLAGRWASVRELAELVKKVQPRTRVPGGVPLWTARAGLPLIRSWSKIRGEQGLYTREALRTIETGHRNICTEKAAIELGFAARPLEQTVADTLEWFMHHFKETR
ncbi:MAG TPA: NAD-dependent epimerase/dehydratase family protein [Bacteroidetes bacterium]|nr:NAD-dependent epimerase/dehydratase family protein [Bacteroidota bacterium]